MSEPSGSSGAQERGVWIPMSCLQGLSREAVVDLCVKLLVEGHPLAAWEILSSQARGSHIWKALSLARGRWTPLEEGNPALSAQVRELAGHCIRDVRMNEVGLNQPLLPIQLARCFEAQSGSFAQGAMEQVGWSEAESLMRGWWAHPDERKMTPEFCEKWAPAFEALPKLQTICMRLDWEGERNFTRKANAPRNAASEGAGVPEAGSYAAIQGHRLEFQGVGGLTSLCALKSAGPLRLAVEFLESKGVDVVQELTGYSGAAEARRYSALQVALLADSEACVAYILERAPRVSAARELGVLMASLKAKSPPASAQFNHDAELGKRMALAERADLRQFSGPGVDTVGRARL